MQERGFDQLPVTKKGSSKLIGMVTLGDGLAKIASKRATLQSEVGASMIHFPKSKKFDEVTVNTPLESLDTFFNTNYAAIVTETINGERLVRHVVTKVDLLAFLVKQG
ncbi:hypothetical protein BC830DRAFT_1146763 [Chytriomyces sp. MP71]|nr:hypothetical protein BC830DRAFT_1146763 [Chytriomyces sp. MP71]